MYLRWLADSAKFNEWCNPIDYETEEAVAEQERLGLVLPPERAGSAPAFASAVRSAGSPMRYYRLRQNELVAI